MFVLLQRLSNSVEYTLAASELIISGSGEITRNGAESKGSVSLVTKVTIKEGPTIIGEKAFSSFKDLESVSIPKSVTLMIGQPFSSCGKLSKIEVSKESTYFCNDENFILYTKDKTTLIRAPVKENLPIPEGVKELQSYAFNSDKFNYGTVVFPSSLSTLCDNAFYNAYFDSVKFRSESKLNILKGFSYAMIYNFLIPNSVTIIDIGAFSYAKLPNILFEDNSKLDKICRNAFGKSKISKITLPESVTLIDEFAFKESLITEITIGSKCSNISLTAFAGCNKLSKIIISENNANYSSVGGILMNGLGTEIIFIPLTMETIKIPQTVNNIGQTVLQGCSNLTEIVLEGVNSEWDAESGVLYTKGFTEIVGICGGLTTVTAHSNVQKIGNYAAYGCTKLVNFSFAGEIITQIGDYSFAKSSLPSFDLPNTVTTIGKNAFEGTLSLKTFNMNDESLVSQIPYYCFYTSVLESFSLGKNVVKINTGAFYKCKSLRSFTFSQNSKLEEINSYAFEESALKNIVIPSSVLRIEDRFLRFCKQLETVVFTEPSQLTTIREFSFDSCTNLWKVVLPNSCTTLESKAFIGCNLLTTLEHKLSTIGNSAFEKCISLTSFNFSSKQTIINSGVFLDCYNLISFTVDSENEFLKDIDGCVYSKDEKTLYLFPPGQEIAKIPPKTTKFADNAFAWSPKLKFVAFYSDSNLTTIGITAFYECKRLTTVQFPAKLNTIKRNSFYGCTSLRSVLFPPTLSVIESEAFIGCSNLRSVKYCGTKGITGENAFESSVVVSVTDFYPIEKFCSNRISRKLSYDCEIKQEFLPTCKGSGGKYISFSSLLISLYIFSI